MKRLLMYALFAVGLVFPAVASAQQMEERPIRYGIVGAINLNDVQTGADAFDDVSDTMVGFQAGIQGSYQVVEVFSINPELVFSRRGWDTEGTALGQNLNLNYNFSYLELPVLLTGSLEVADGIRPKVFAGPHASLFLDGSQDGDPSPFTGGAEEIDGDQVNDLQFGWTGGIGANFDIGRLTLTSDLRYQRNLTGVFEDVGENVDSVEHESWQATVGFLF